MKTSDFIKSLILWIEKNINKPLTLDMVSLKSGYTKWHLQRLFKTETGMSIGEYIRSRKLSEAALMLRITNMSIYDIALTYSYDSQQTFTRVFKKRFNTTPSEYRKKEFWDSSQYLSVWEKQSNFLLEPTIVSIPSRVFSGKIHKYTCKLDHLEKFNIDARTQYWKDNFNSKNKPDTIYALYDISVGCKYDELQINYITENMDLKNSLYTIEIEKGNYLKFQYNGTIKDYPNFIIYLYKQYLPKLNITRRNGADIECYYLNKCSGNFIENESDIISCDYLIPCKNSRLKYYD